MDKTLFVMFAALAIAIAGLAVGSLWLIGAAIIVEAVVLTKMLYDGKP